MKNECKKCLLYESAQNVTLDLIKEKIQKLSSEEKTEESLYLKRLSCCKGCDYLISGVCRKCGCYVEFRAAFKKQKCPDASNRRW